MEWQVIFDSAFEEEFDAFSPTVQDAILTSAKLLAMIGLSLGRPHADTLNGSRYANMKELRCTADDGVWRVAFAFDPVRQAILLTAGDKAGVSQKRFYRRLVTIADERFARHLAMQKGKP